MVLRAGKNNIAVQYIIIYRYFNTIIVVSMK